MIFSGARSRGLRPARLATIVPHRSAVIVKCGSPELTARLRALGRRSATPLPPVLRTADVMLDPGRRVAFRNGRPTAVKTTIRRLRAKLGDPPVIHTVREGGYRIGEA